MLRITSLLVSISAFWGSEPLKVTTQIPPGPYFVGQAIEIRVEAAGMDGAVLFEPPGSPLAQIKSLAVDPAKPSVGRFLVILRRAGPLEIAPFRARSGDQSASTRPIKLTVAGVPSDGRTAAFLGGVGQFEVQSEAEPLTLRLGQTLEFRMKITGQGAWGSDRLPDLSSWKSLGGGLRIENLADSVEGIDPPIRTFRYRIRPKVAGRVVLPPLAVACFDPRIGRYSTRTTASLGINVEPTPRLDPSSLDYQPILTHGDPRWGYYAVKLGLGFAGLATLALWVLARRQQRQRPANPSRLARELARKLGGDSEVEAARMIVDALTCYLERVSDRTPGVLTPPEAHHAFENLTQDSELASRAERLMVACDRARYRGSSGAEGGLVEAGRDFFERVARALERKPREKGGPREAVETG